MTKMAPFRKKVELSGYGMAISGSVFLKVVNGLNWRPVRLWAESSERSLCARNGY